MGRKRPGNSSPPRRHSSASPSRRRSPARFSSLRATTHLMSPGRSWWSTAGLLLDADEVAGETGAGPLLEGASLGQVAQLALPEAADQNGAHVRAAQVL